MERTSQSTINIVAAAAMFPKLLSVRSARPPALPLPSLPNDFTALVNTVVRFEPPLPRSPAAEE